MKFDVFTVAMGCVLLASKLEENFKNLREVWLLTFVSVLSNDDKLGCVYISSYFLATAKSSN